MIVRTRQDRDVPALAEVLVRVYERDGYPVEGVADPVTWLYPERLLEAWTALIEDQPVGHIAVTEASETDDVTRAWRKFSGSTRHDLAIPVRLFVDPPHRNKGAGELLMAATAKFATLHRYSVAFDVMAKDQQAIQMYERAGCRRIGEITHEHSGGHREPAYVYVAPVG